MVIVKLKGELENQMLQYAFAKQLAYPTDGYQAVSTRLMPTAVLAAGQRG